MRLAKLWNDPDAPWIARLTFGVVVSVLMLVVFMVFVDRVEQSRELAKPPLGAQLSVPLGWHIVTYNSSQHHYVCADRSGLTYRVCYPQVVIDE